MQSLSLVGACWLLNLVVAVSSLAVPPRRVVRCARRPIQWTGVDGGPFLVDRHCALVLRQVAERVAALDTRQRQPRGVAHTSSRRRSPQTFPGAPELSRRPGPPLRCLRPHYPPAAIYHSRRECSQHVLRERCCDNGALRRARDVRSSHVRAGKEKSQVRWVDGRGFHANQHLVGGGNWNWDLVQ